MGVQAVLDIFAARGYALKTSVLPGGGGSGRLTFTVRQEGPANLWSLQVRLVRERGACLTHVRKQAAAAHASAGRHCTCTNTAATLCAASLSSPLLEGSAKLCLPAVLAEPCTRSALNRNPTPARR